LEAEPTTGPAEVPRTTDATTAIDRMVFGLKSIFLNRVFLAGIKDEGVRRIP
jgi:hypothetical protein